MPGQQTDRSAKPVMQLSYARQQPPAGYSRLEGVARDLTVAAVLLSAPSALLVLLGGPEPWLLLIFPAGLLFSIVGFGVALAAACIRQRSAALWSCVSINLACVFALVCAVWVSLSM